MQYDINHWMIAWTPIWAKDETKAGGVEIGPWPDETGWSDAYMYTAGCCNAGWNALSSYEQKIDEIIRGFFELVLGDGIDAFALHLELSKIKGYLDYKGSIGFGRGQYIFFQDGKLSPYT